MERLQHLISKLNEQNQQKESPLQMLVTLKHIEAELTIMHTAGGTARQNPGVSVVMPTINIANRRQEQQPVTLTVPAQQPVFTEEREAVVRVPETVQPAAQVATPAPIPAPTPAYRNGAVASPANHTSPAAEALKKYQPQAATPVTDPAPRREPVMANGDHTAPQVWSVDPLLEVPTLSHQPGAPELNDIIGLRNPSINDRLKDTGMTEKGYQLKGAPVKELRKAIGVNDRYVFINELFRGDEAMYERSIKTINNFRILPEAQYWMERELKIKIGWDDSRDIVQHFYELVSRRFS